MKKEAINVEKAPAAIGPYTHANMFGDLVFTSGQLPLVNGELEQDPALAAKACLENLKVILEGCGSSLDQCLKVTIFVEDMNDFATINEVYGQYFTENQPARSCVQVAKLPKGATVEMEAIAYRQK